MLRYLFLTLIFIISFDVHATKHGLFDDDEAIYDEAFFATIDRIEEEHRGSKKAKTEELDDDLFDEEALAAIDASIRDYQNRTKTPEVIVQEAIDTPLAPNLPRSLKPLNSDIKPRKLLFHTSDGESSTPYANRPLLEQIIYKGTLLKFLANVYKGNLKENANVFLPHHTVKIIKSDGTVSIQKDFFRTPKGQLVIFASGGTTNAWEKTVSRVYQVLFGEEVKVIRASWIHKHLHRRGIRQFDMRNYQDREQELHSELYFDLFFRHFFLPSMMEKGKVSEILLNAYSWWEVCDNCERRFTGLKDLCRKKGINEFNCRVATARPYSHSYEQTVLQTVLLEAQNERDYWNAIWSKLKEFMRLHRNDPIARKKFWTQTVQGLELSKWIGQAFVENRFQLDGRYAEPDATGDLLLFFNEINGHQGDGDTEIQSDEMEQFRSFIRYQSEVNWDLSCWKSPPDVSRLQYNWKKYHDQQVEPHFNFREIDSYRDEEGTTTCDMCGQKGLVDISLVYHPKYKISRKLLALEDVEDDLDEEQMILSDEQDEGIVRGQRIRSLQVGSECVKYLLMTKGDLQEWRDNNPIALTEVKTEDRATLLGHYDALDQVAAEKLYQIICEGCQNNDGQITTRAIAKAKGSEWDNAKDMAPFLKILLDEKLIEKAGRGAYKVVK